VPLYEYECKQCASRFEKIQKFSDEPETICPKCGGEVERLLSAPAVQFKGEGWYVTDYAKKGGAAKSTSTDSTADKKTDTKSATETPKPSAPASTEKKD
jgi:putative FmdB family regulatory protein